MLSQYQQNGTVNFDSFSRIFLDAKLFFTSIYYSLSVDKTGFEVRQLCQCPRMDLKLCVQKTTQPKLEKAWKSLAGLMIVFTNLRDFGSPEGKLKWFFGRLAVRTVSVKPPALLKTVLQTPVESEFSGLFLDLSLLFETSEGWEKSLKFYVSLLYSLTLFHVKVWGAFEFSEISLLFIYTSVV